MRFKIDLVRDGSRKTIVEDLELKADALDFEVLRAAMENANVRAHKRSGFSLAGVTPIEESVEDLDESSHGYGIKPYKGGVESGHYIHHHGKNIGQINAYRVGGGGGRVAYTFKFHAGKGPVQDEMPLGINHGIDSRSIAFQRATGLHQNWLSKKESVKESVEDLGEGATKSSDTDWFAQRDAIHRYHERSKKAGDSAGIRHAKLGYREHSYIHPFRIGDSVHHVDDPHKTAHTVIRATRQTNDLVLRSPDGKQHLAHSMKLNFADRSMKKWSEKKQDAWIEKQKLLDREYNERKAASRRMGPMKESVEDLTESSNDDRDIWFHVRDHLRKKVHQHGTHTTSGKALPSNAPGPVYKAALIHHLKDHPFKVGHVVHIVKHDGSVDDTHYTVTEVPQNYAVVGIKHPSGLITSSRTDALVYPKKQRS